MFLACVGDDTERPRGGGFLATFSGDGEMKIARSYRRRNRTIQKEAVRGKQGEGGEERDADGVCLLIPPLSCLALICGQFTAVEQV